MLTQMAEGVWVHQSGCIRTNTVVVQGADGVLLVDPGLTETELRGIAEDVRELGQRVVAGFATHPDWDHALWHPWFGDVPRYATARCAASLRDLLAQPGWEAQVAEGLPPEIAGEVPMHLFGQVTGLPAGTAQMPWAGPAVRIIEHRAHAPGHAALLAGERGVLVAGDMLSDVLVPMPGIGGADDPIGDYLAALRRFESVADGIEAFVPGHGSVGDAEDLRARIALDRAYVHALREGQDPDDPRIGPDAKPGWEWVASIHQWQAGQLAQSPKDSAG